MAGTSAADQQANQRALAEGASQLAAVLRAAYQHIDPDVLFATVGLDVTNRVRQLLSTPGGGRTYGRRGPGRPAHTASVPGEPPAVDTGRLRASYTWEPGRDERGPYVDIGTNVEYAPFLEFGTSRMEARPHLRPAIEQARDLIVERIADELGAKLRTEVRQRGGR